MEAIILKAITKFSLLILIPIDAAYARDLNVTIERNMTCADGSIMGRMIVDGEEIGRTLELPWKDNQNGVSNIPKGSYETTIRSDGTMQWRIELEGVPGRSHIQIHRGNYSSQTKGCILLGAKLAGNKCGVADSVSAMNNLRNKVEAAADGGNMSLPVDINVEVRNFGD